MKSTGEPEAVKWFWKKVSLVWKMIFLFAIYVLFEIVTVSAVKGWDREKTITTLGTAAPDWKKQRAVGESISRNIRYLEHIWFVIGPMVILAIMILIGIHKYPEDKVNFENLNQTGKSNWCR